jgi:hypothetical protein
VSSCRDSHDDDYEGNCIFKSLLFWGVTQRRLIVDDVSGQPIVPTAKGQAVQEFFACLTLEDETDMSRNVGTVLTILRCVESQNSADLISTATEA